MKICNALLLTSVPALLVLAGASVALQGMGETGQGTAKEAGAKADEMHMYTPTKEHEWLQSRVGTWDCTVNCPMMGEPTKATETTKAFGDFWVISSFEGNFMGAPFQGKSLMTFDPMKKKYVSTWCDTMTPVLFVMEGTMDAAGKKLTSTGQGPNMEGQMVSYTNVVELKSDDHVVFTMYETSKGAQDPSTMTIEYKRRM